MRPLSFKRYVVTTFVGTIGGFAVLAPLAMVLSHIVHKSVPPHEMAISHLLAFHYPLWSFSFSILGGVMGLVFGLLHYKLMERTAEVETATEYTNLVLDSMVDGMITINTDYRILSANRAFLNGQGLDIEQVVGKRCYKVTHRLDRPCHEAGEECPVYHALQTGMPARLIHHHYNSGGDEMIVELTASPIFDRNGNVIRIIEITRDITEHRRLEQQLRQVQKMEAIGTLAGGIAHDFNNVLTAIMGYAELMEMREKEADVFRKNIAGIMSAAERAKHLIGGLLAFGKQQVLEKKPVDLNSAIRDVAGLIDQLVGEDITVRHNLFHGDLPVMADPGQVGQVLINLAANARDAMPKGGEFLIETSPAVLEQAYVARESTVPAGKYALLKTADRGGGIHSDTMRRIFEPFFTTKDTGKGTGLGLSIVYGIVKQHDGEIMVDSEVGRGAAFTIYLPLMDTAVKTGVSDRADAPPWRGTETILLIEDDDQIRENVSGFFRGQGYTVLETRDGGEAVSVLARNAAALDILVSDMVLPGMALSEICERIKRLRPGLKAVLMSGYHRDVLERKGIPDIDFTYIQKPFSMKQLAVRVRETLDG